MSKVTFSRNVIITAMGQQTLGPEDTCTRVQLYEDYVHNERHVTQIVHRIYIATSDSKLEKQFHVHVCVHCMCIELCLGHRMTDCFGICSVASYQHLNKLYCLLCPALKLLSCATLPHTSTDWTWVLTAKNKSKLFSVCQSWTFKWMRKKSFTLLGLNWILFKCGWAQFLLRSHNIICKFTSTNVQTHTKQCTNSLILRTKCLYTEAVQHSKQSTKIYLTIISNNSHSYFMLCTIWQCFLFPCTTEHWLDSWWQSCKWCTSPFRD